MRLSRYLGVGPRWGQDCPGSVGWEIGDFVASGPRGTKRCPNRRMGQENSALRRSRNAELSWLVWFCEDKGQLPLILEMKQQPPLSCVVCPPAHV